jgi:hypothetical protein
MARFCPPSTLCPGGPVTLKNGGRLMSSVSGIATFAQLYHPRGILPLISQGLAVSAADAAARSRP